MKVKCVDQSSLERVAEKLAEQITLPAIIFLRGSLGAGKTTLVRAWLRALGVTGLIRSPTYTLVEPYDTKQGRFYHFDLYRIGDPDELDMLGFRDYVQSGCFIEWPENAQNYLPRADLTIDIDFAGEGRELTITASSAKMQQLEGAKLDAI